MAFAIRSEYWLAIKPEIDRSILLQDFSFNSVLISILIAIPIFWLFGLYRTIFRYTGFSIFFTILMSSFVYGILYFTIAVYGIKIVPRPIGFFQPMLLFFAVLASRLGVRYFFIGNLNLKNSFKKKKSFSLWSR